MQAYTVNNVRIFDADKGVFSGPGYISVENGKITFKKRFENVLDGKGGYLIPGLFEMHGHFFDPIPGKGYVDTFDASLPLYLSNGVTTVVSKGENDAQKAFAMKEASEKGEIDSPRILTPGNWLSRAPAFLPSILSPETLDGLREAYYSQREKRDLVKIYTNMTADWLKELCLLSHEDGLKVYGHIDAMTAQQAVDAGIDGLEHGVYFMPEFKSSDAPDSIPRGLLKAYYAFDPRSDLAKTVLEKLISHNVALIPTVSCIETVSSSEMADFFAERDVWSYYAEEAREKVRQSWEPKRRGEMTASLPFVKEMLAKQREFMSEFLKRGGKIYAGTDPSVAPIFGGITMARECDNLRSFGMTPAQVLRAASLGSAEEMGIADQTGSLEEGKAADMVLLKNDPLVSLYALEEITTTFARGKAYDPAELRARAKGAIK